MDIGIAIVLSVSILAIIIGVAIIMYHVTKNNISRYQESAKRLFLDHLDKSFHEDN